MYHVPKENHGNKHNKLKNGRRLITAINLLLFFILWVLTTKMEITMEDTALGHMLVVDSWEIEVEGIHQQYKNWQTKWSRGNNYGGKMIEYWTEGRSWRELRVEIQNESSLKVRRWLGIWTNRSMNLILIYIFSILVNSHIIVFTMNNLKINSLHANFSHASLLWFTYSMNEISITNPLQLQHQCVSHPIWPQKPNLQQLPTLQHN